MNNFAQVDSKVFRGSAPTDDELRQLRDKYGISRIVSLDEDEGGMIEGFCKRLGLEQEIIHLTDGNSKKLGTIKSKILDKTLFPIDKKTFVHCKHGKDRTSMVVAMYRVFNGDDLFDVLSEATKFKMGQGMSKASYISYYEAVKSFAEELDENSCGDKNNFGIPEGFVNSFGMPEGDITRIASDRIYRECSSSNVMFPGVWSKKKPKSSGKLFSAIISSDASIKKIFRYTKEEGLQAKREGVDAVSVGNDLIIYNPNILIDMDEEDVASAFDVGLYSNYDGLAQFSFPGSGGLIESTPGGFAGQVQLPFGRF